MSNFDASNPDHLAALISGYDTKSLCKTGRDAKGKTILDNLARLAVCRRQGRIISIAALKVGENIELVIADNCYVDKNVISFLGRFLASLSRMRKMTPPVVDKSVPLEGPPSLLDKIPRELDDGQLDKEIHALKVMVLRHNLPKIRRRFFKHYYRFQDSDFYFHFIEDENPP